MSRKRRTISEADGTPVETDEEIVDESAAPEVEKPRKRFVIWTRKGEEQGAFSEHGLHKAGDKVDTDHADILVERGFATEAE